MHNKPLPPGIGGRNVGKSSALHQNEGDKKEIRLNAICRKLTPDPLSGSPARHDHRGGEMSCTGQFQEQAINLLQEHGHARELILVFTR